MSDNSDEHIIWEDAEDDEMDGDYRPPPDDYDEDEFDFDDDVDDVEHDGELQYISFAPDDDEEGDEDEEEEEEEVEEEDDQTYGRTLGVESPSPSALLAALMGAMGGGTRQGLSFLEIERLLGRAQRQDNTSWWEAQVDPHPAGLALLRSGEFGPVGPWSPAASAARRRPSEIYSARRRRYYGADLGTRNLSARYQLTTHIRDPPIPNTPGTVVAKYPDVPYVGQFCGPNDSIFYSATRGFMLYLYDMAGVRSSHSTGVGGNPPADAEYTNNVDPTSDDDDDDDEWGNGGWRPRRVYRGRDVEETSLRRIKAEQGEIGSWTVTDAHADRTGNRMIYSSITPWVHMMSTSDDGTQHVPLKFGSHNDGYGIWSIRFSADGKEVVAGASDGLIMVYDIEAQRRSLRVIGHWADVNAVCFADESSTNVLVSGSDDGYVKIWDRRSLASYKPAGVLPGATEGITYTAPKGDGRYIVVNSKDQAARLYDLRKMRSWNEFEGERDAADKWGVPHFDYRHMPYPRPRRLAHPRDCSVMTYRGHWVLRTLIRCHFSPLESTGQSYIYSGSADGRIHIWSLDGRLVQILNRGDSRPLHQHGVPGEFIDPSEAEAAHPVAPRGPPRQIDFHGFHIRGGHTVRDVAWHAHTPTLMSTCWNHESGRYGSTGSVAMHEWKGLGKGGLHSLEDWVEKAVQEQAARAT